MARQILRNIRMLEFGLFVILLIYDGCCIVGIPLSTSSKSKSRYDQILGTGYKDQPGPFEPNVDFKNRRRLLSTNDSNTDDSIGAKIREFYADDNNMALFCILPLLILIYGGCSVIYCVHKCRKNFKKRKREHQKRSKSPSSVSTSDNVSLISGTDNLAVVKPKRNSSRPFSSNSNRVAPEPPSTYKVTNTNTVAQKLKLDSNSHVKDLLTDYEFFASWVMAQKAADLIQLQSESEPSDSSLTGTENLTRNLGTTVGGRKQKLVFLT